MVSFVPKGEGDGPLDARPITVMSVIYRMWAASRLKHIKTWQEAWASPDQHGARPGRCTADVYWSIALKIEASLLDGSPLYGLVLDYAKCFDMLPHGILFNTAAELGMNER
eukprot:5327511-Karenia_brevis.AAC.1